MGSYENGIVHRAHKRELSNKTRASGDVMDFALLVADEAIIAEMERVRPAFEAALVWLDTVAPSTAKIVRKAMRRQRSE